MSSSRLCLTVSSRTTVENGRETRETQRVHATSLALTEVFAVESVNDTDVKECRVEAVESVEVVFAVVIWEVSM